MAQSVLVLNYNFEPLNICNERRALVLVLGGKAEVLEQNHHMIITATTSFRVPSVIRLSRLVRRPMPQAKLIPPRNLPAGYLLLPVLRPAHP